jgi:hypothetical protein
MEKTYKNINELKNWQDNPREISPEGYERLINQIKKLGQHTPLIIKEDGTVMSGNMRLRAYKELGITDVWVEVISKDKEHLAMDYALSANDTAGRYDKEALLGLIDQNPEINLEEFAVSFDEPILLKDFMENVTNDLPHKCVCPTCGKKHNSRVNKIRDDEISEVNQPK